MRALYEIENAILECVDLETGEIIDPEKLDALEMEREKKIESVILWRKDLLAEAEAVKKEADTLSKRAKSCESKAEQLKNYISYALNGAKFKTDRCSVSYRNGSGIVLDDITKISAKYWGDIKESWISKTKIKEAIERGETVEGAHQEERQSIIIK